MTQFALGTVFLAQTVFAFWLGYQWRKLKEPQS